MSRRLELISQLRVGPAHDVELTARLMADAADALERAPDVVGDVLDFQRKFGHDYDGRPRVLPFELAEFRRKFLREEVDEYERASFRAQQALASRRPDGVAEDLAEMLDSLVDEVYVAVGTSHFHGFDFAEAWRRVHEKNMMKERARRASDSKRGTLYDVVKPEGWTPPDHSDLVREHAHREE